MAAYERPERAKDHLKRLACVAGGPWRDIAAGFTLDHQTLTTSAAGPEKKEEKSSSSPSGPC